MIIWSYNRMRNKISVCLFFCVYLSGKNNSEILIYTFSSWSHYVVTGWAEWIQKCEPHHFFLQQHIMYMWLWVFYNSYCFYLKLSHLWLTLTGSARVWVNQWTEKTQYTVGETAVIYCNLSTDESAVEGYEMNWVIFDYGNKGRIKDLSKVAAYKHHIGIVSSETSSILTLTNLTVYHTDELVCDAVFLINGRLTELLGNGTILQISQVIQPKGLNKNTTILLFSNNHSSVKRGLEQVLIVSLFFPLAESSTNPTPPLSLSWINYLLLSANIFIFIIGTIICIKLVCNRKCRK